jgi:hypothetical protein
VTYANTERGPPPTLDHVLAFDAVDRRSHGASVRLDDVTTPAAYDYDDAARFVQVARGSRAPEGHAGHARSGSVVERWRVAAKTGPSKALRPVGSVLGSVDDVLKNPRLLEGVHPAQAENILKGAPGWEVGTLGRGRSAGSGWTFRELNARGTDYTGRFIQWHPGTPRHFKGAPYWKVSSGELGTVRFPQ